MVVRRGKPATTARKPAARTATKTARKPATTARKAAPVKRTPTVKKAPDVTMYADKEPTGYHKAFARWIVREVRYNPSEAVSAKAAFLMGVSIATAARPAFQNSDFLTEWREATGEAKRGPKPKTAAEIKRRANRAVVSDDEFDDEGDEFEDDDTDVDEDDDEFDDESEEDDDEFDDDEDSEEDDEEDDDDFEDEEEEEAPPKRTTRRAPAKKAPAKPATRKAPAKRAAKAADDEDLF